MRVWCRRNRLLNLRCSNSACKCRKSRTVSLVVRPLIGVCSTCSRTMAALKYRRVPMTSRLASRGSRRKVVKKLLNKLRRRRRNVISARLTTRCSIMVILMLNNR